MCTAELLCICAVAIPLEYLNIPNLFTAIVVYKWPAILLASNAKLKSNCQIDKKGLWGTVSFYFWGTVSFYFCQKTDVYFLIELVLKVQ